MRRRAGGPVQQWIDSIPSSAKSEDVVIASECQEHSLSHEHKPLTPTEPKDIPFSKNLRPPSMTISAPNNVPNSPAMNTPILPSSLPHQRLVRDASLQSDSSHCSSVESLLELRKADPTAILLDLGFGGSSETGPQTENGTISRIPRRFLQPSSLRGIAVDQFLKQQQETTESFDSVSLGYRGLTGSPYVAPSEIVQKIMERLREHESHEVDTSSYNCDQYNSMHQNEKLSVLSPDNRQFLERPRSKSPDMRNKRMIIGQKSFAFGCDGNLIEISPNDEKLTCDTEDDHNSLLDANESIELKQSSPEESTFEHQYLSKYDKKLAKQLSFDDTVEFPEADQLLKDDRESQNSLNIAQSGTNVDDRKQEYNAIDTTPEKREFSDIRRASDGSCDTESFKIKIFYRRRFSDSAMRIAERQSKEHALMQKRRNFKRQSRVCDTSAMHYCDLSPIRSNIPSIVIIEPNVDNEVSSDVTDSTHQLNIPKSFESTEDKSNLEPKMDMESSFKSNMPSPSNVSESIDRLECFEAAQEDSASSDHSCTEDSQTCCYKSKVCKDRKHGKNCPDCCCYIDKRKYRKKMEKIMQENKRLEDMLARSRREVAEIRDMLSSVLSVRMEPGF